MRCRLQSFASNFALKPAIAVAFAIAMVASSKSMAVPQSAGTCERCLATCAAAGQAYPVGERPLRPPDDVHHNDRKIKTLFEDARAQDPAFGGRNIDGAVAGYRGAVRLAPKNAEYRNYLAAALMRRGEFEEARYNLKKATAMRPAEAKYVVNLGYAYHKLGDEVRAMATFMRAVALDPRNIKARLFAAHAFRTLGMLEEAAAEYTRVLALAPRHKSATKGLSSVRN